MKLASEGDLRRIPQLSEVPSSWPVFNLSEGQSRNWSTSEVRTIWQKESNTQSAKGYISIMIGKDNAAFLDKKYHIYRGRSDPKDLHRNKLILKNEDQVIMIWTVNHRSAWQRLTQNQYVLFQCTAAGGEYQIRRCKDRLELYKSEQLLAVMALGGFEARPVSISPDTSAELALSLMYSGLLQYEGPRVHSPGFKSPIS